MGLFDKIKKGLSKTRNAFSGRMDELVENYQDLDDDFFEDLTDILIMADVGVPTSELAVNRLREQVKAEKIGNPEKAREALKTDEHLQGLPQRECSELFIKRVSFS